MATSPLSLRRRLKQKTGDHAVHANKNKYLQAIFDGKDPYLLAALEIVEIGKGAADTFKPYKSKSYIYNDLTQLAHGIGNLVVAAGRAAKAVGLFAFSVLKALTYNLFKEGPASCVKNLAKAVYHLFGGLLQAAATALRGALQIATAPLTLVVRMPIRGVIYLRKGQNFQTFEENAGVKRLVALGDDVVARNEPQSKEITKQIIFQLNRKYHKATDDKTGRGQESDIRQFRSGEYDQLFAAVTPLLEEKDNAANQNDLTDDEQRRSQAYLAVFRRP